jgi:hypothetical protein
VGSSARLTTPVRLKRSFTFTGPLLKAFVPLIPGGSNLHDVLTAQDIALMALVWPIFNNSAVVVDSNHSDQLLNAVD